MLLVLAAEWQRQAEHVLVELVEAVEAPEAVAAEAAAVVVEEVSLVIQHYQERMLIVFKEAEVAVAEVVRDPLFLYRLSCSLAVQVVVRPRLPLSFLSSSLLDFFVSAS